MHTDLIKQKSNSALEITSKKTIKLELQTNWHYFLKKGIKPWYASCNESNAFEMQLTKTSSPLCATPSFP